MNAIPVWAWVLILSPFAPIIPIWIFRAVKLLPGVFVEYLVAMKNLMIQAVVSSTKK